MKTGHWLCVIAALLAAPVLAAAPTAPAAVHAQAPASAAAAAAPRPASAAAAELERLSKTWMDAMLHHDKDGLESAMAPEFVLRGDAQRPDIVRASWLDNLFHHLDIKKWEQTNISAQVYGDVGVVTSTYAWTGNFQGRAFDSRGACTDVWRATAARWQVVSRTCIPFPGSHTLGGGVVK